MTGRILGKIVNLQVQASSLKLGGSPQRYTTEPIVSVDRLELTRHGTSATTEESHTIIDIHNRKHPHSKYRPAQNNGISIGFTSHYSLMRERFGDHMFTGCAGENIVVEHPHPIAVEHLDCGLQIYSSQGDLKCSLHSIAEIPPCLPFSQYALRAMAPTREELKKALDFLSPGIRGFFGVLSTETAPIIAIGDVVLAAN